MPLVLPSPPRLRLRGLTIRQFVTICVIIGLLTAAFVVVLVHVHRDITRIDHDPEEIEQWWEAIADAAEERSTEPGQDTP